LEMGKAMPELAFGTWRSEPGKVTDAVALAIQTGYRHLDCAAVYENEKEVGAGIKAGLAALADESKASGSAITREDLYITSKLWNTEHAPEDVEPACRETLKNLGIDCLDLYLIHWPVAFRKIPGNLFPELPDGSEDVVEVPLGDTWKAMEALVDKGLTKAIGVSNFTVENLEAILKIARIKPVCNQVEAHAYFPQRSLRDYCHARGIRIVAYCVLGNVQSYLPCAISDEKVIDLAKKYKKSPAQLLIRFAIQFEYVAITKSVTRERIIENFKVFDFIISDEDMATLEKLKDPPVRLVSPGFMPWMFE